MPKSIIELVDQLPTDNITVKVLKSLDSLLPNQWNNLTGFENSIRSLTGESEPKMIQRISDRAVALYHDSTQGYQTAITLYQTIDKADLAMATAALANKVAEKVNFLAFLGNITPKADVAQTIDLGLKLMVEIIAFCQLNGIPKPNLQAFVNALNTNYQDAALMRMSTLVCLDGLLPLGPDFISKIHQTIQTTDLSIITQNPIFQATSNFIPGNNPGEKVGFIDQSVNAAQGWMNNLISKTGITRQSISQSLGNFIEIADENLDFAAAFLDQTTNYYEHTGIQTVARKLILTAYQSIQTENPHPRNSNSHKTVPSVSSGLSSYSVNQTVEVWDKKEEKWYEATIQEIKDKKYFVHYVGYESSDDDWVKEKNIRTRNHQESDDNGYTVGQKVKVWDDSEEEWYTAIIQKIERNQYYVHYIDSDSSSDEWLDADEIR